MSTMLELKDWGRLEAIAEVQRLSRQNAELLEQQEALRHSLAQEICATLVTRGFYSPGANRASDLIGAVGLALDTQTQKIKELLEALRATMKALGAATEVIYSKRPVTALADEIENARRLFHAAISKAKE